MHKKILASKKRKAFSLVELAIVIIVIGLLVAAVIGGASLTKNATLRGVISEARGYQTAVNAFYERFQALPGDYNQNVGGSFTAPNVATVLGNADGKIQFYANAALGTATNRLEGNLAWQQLKNGGFVDAVFTPGSANTAANGEIVASTYVLTPGLSITGTPTAGGASGIPTSKLPNSGWAFDYVLASNQNQLILTGTVTAPAIAASAVTVQNMQPTGALLPIDALSIDTKMDDTAPRTGKVRSAGDADGTLTASPTVLGDGNGLSACNGATTYTTSATTTVCALSFQVDPDI
ncbi:MAG: prepilin-type N-terminal cleavage/methylation protein [Rickettsiaceae bacterium]|jgi:prepilin-type N-terminal cleavage/methylation domain-containing protein|nr:prepilin-type N-terminal cleavage/methylation protein [Rickettsiaceae bacterium]